jgi:hypothetical protein
MDQATIRFLAEVAARRSLSRAINAKAENKSGMLRGNGLYGDNGAPTPKSGKKAKLTLALPRGKADLDAQARRATRQADRLTGPFPWRIDDKMRKQCEAMPKDDVVSVDMPSAMGKVAKNMTSRAWRPGDPDGSEPFALPGGNAMPMDTVRGKAKMVTTQGYLLTPETDDDKPRFVKPRPDRQNRPKRDVQIVKKKVFVLQK